MPKRFSKAIHWFRRDLRLTDNTALHAATREGEQVFTVYIISPWSGQHAWTGPPRQAWLSGCLGALEESIAVAGGKLIFRRGEAVAELEKLIRETGAEAVFYNHDPDPFGQATEAALAKLAAEMGVAVRGFKDAVLHERDEVLTAADKPYRVFTPYRRSWESMEKPPVLPAVRRLAQPPAKLASEPCPTPATWKLAAPDIQMPEPGEKAARQRFEHALSDIIPSYAATRNTPMGPTTSRLSPDLRMGTLSIREIYHRVRETAAASPENESIKKSCATYISELAWREFYMQILWHFPEVLDQEFDPQWRGLPWNYDENLLERWKQGKTGFPIVDAGMRELAATGWMHNRVRMITAMFLTKDLRVDWRLGEQYFMQQLIDGEIASNNGGWQWSAGTGADAAPYFRIQNPWSQTKSYDPEGQYIRHWVPELRHAPKAALMDPPSSDMLFKGMDSYPAPMVDHSGERDRTLAMFKTHRARNSGGMD